MIVAALGGVLIFTKRCIRQPGLLQFDFETGPEFFERKQLAKLIDDPAREFAD